MKAKQAILCGFLTVVFALISTACGQLDDSKLITYTVMQTGGQDGVTTTTDIVFIFSASVDSLNLTAADIFVSGAALKGSDVLTGSGTSRTLPITVNATGTATVAIAKTDIETTVKTVFVYKAGQPSPSDITYTATQDGGTDGATTGIKFTFSASVNGLTVTEITVTGAASKGSAILTGSGISWTLAPITVNSAGMATVSINRTGIETAHKSVLVYQAGQTPEYMDFLGQWLMIGADNNWEPEAGEGYGYNETITLSADQFKLDSTYQGEYLYFNISGWTKITGAGLTVSTWIGDSTSGYSTTITYQEGWTLSLYGGTTIGYGSAANYTTMKLYKLNEPGTAKIRRNNPNTSDVIERVYVKQ